LVLDFDDIVQRSTLLAAARGGGALL